GPPIPVNTTLACVTMRGGWDRSTGGWVMTSKGCGLFFVVLALIGLGFAAAQPAQAQQPVPMVCGSVAVNTSHVLPQNCEANCRFRGHTPAECAKLVPICRTCWNIYLSLA